MSVEFKFYFVKDLKYKRTNGYNASDIMAFLDIYGMGTSDEEKAFIKCFDKDIPFDMYLETSNEKGDEIMGHVTHNPYGEHIKYCSDKTRATEALHLLTKLTDYKYYKYLYKMFQMLSKDDELYFVMYKY